jgi:Bax protein
MTVKLSTVILFVGLLTGCTETPIHSSAEVKPSNLFQTRQIKELTSSQGLSIREKKKRFFSFLTPLIAQESNIILNQRSRLINAINQKNDNQWLNTLAKQYQLPVDNDYQELLRRVDILPIELILSQSANESMWGESRFAQQGNNLFGQWCFTQHCGIIPLNRDAKKTHEVAIFKHVNASIRSYLHNINTNPAYVKLRTLRSRLRFLQRPLNAKILATGLEKYSERGKDYVSEIQSMIKINHSLIRSGLLPSSKNKAP